MRDILAGFALCAALATSAFAEETIRPLLTADDTRGFEAVGRIDLGRYSFCTGTLIEENLVLTAAHCLFDPETMDRRDLSRMEFRAGWRDGRALAYRGVRRAIVHPEYVFEGNGEGLARVVNDIALLELDRPIRGNGIHPFGTAAKPRKGDEVSIVSYAVEREERPSLQEVCDVLARPADMLVVSCPVDFGASGAPILSFEDGGPRIVSVVSAKAEAMGRPVSLGADIDGSLEVLIALARNAPSTVSRTLPVVRTAGSAGQSAKFIRP
jgi:V8-like Glu-specific endopeptidase